MLLAIAAPAAADAARSRVAVVRPPADDDLSSLVTTRILAELSAAGFDVVEIDAPPDTSSRAVVEAPSKAVATFAVERVGNRPAVDVWLADQITGKTTVRRLDLQIGASDRAVAILAIRAVELLRASLLEIVVPPKAEGGQPSEGVPPDVDVFVRKTSAPPRTMPRGLFEGVGIEMGAGMNAAFSAIGPSAGLALRGSWGRRRLHHGFAARMTLAAFELGPTLRAPGGTATFGQELAMIEGVFFAPAFGHPSAGGPVSAFISVGLGVSRFHVKGSAEAPNRPASADLWSPTATLGGGVGVRIAPGTALVLSVHGALMMRRANIDIAGQTAAKTLPASSGATLGLLATF
jgi:hypothetical protein